MTKKILLSLVLASSVSIYAAEVTTNQIQVAVDQPNNDALIDASSKLSLSLVDLTSQMVDESANANGEYTQAMLQLSQDIGTMADRINAMADKIVTTQEIQSENYIATQENMLEAQKNTIEAISNLTGDIKTTLEQAQTKMGMAENSFNNTQQSSAIEKMKFSIEQSPSVANLVEQLDNVKPQYRFMVMNAIKEKLAKENSENRVNELNKLNTKTIEEIQKNIIAKQNSVRESKQYNMKGSNSTMINPTVSLDDAFAVGGEDRGGSNSMSEGISGMTSSVSSAAGGMSSVSSAAGGMSSASSSGGPGGM